MTRTGLIRLSVAALATALMPSLYAQQSESAPGDAPFGYDRRGQALRFPPGTEPGMPHAGYNPDLPTLWLIGDSTVKEGRDNGRNGGRWGWGHEIDRYFNTDHINIENQALGGTSSRSFMTGGWWEQVLEMIRPGDFLMIQFGHNDGGIDSEVPRIRARGTLPGNSDESRKMTLRDGAIETVHTYGWYLRQYIAQAQSRDATVIVCSLIPRNDWQHGSVIRAQDDTYVLWAREAAAQGRAHFINLNHIICNAMDPMGEAFASNALFRPDDHTHPITLGAQLNAWCVVTGIKALGDALALNQYLNAAAETTKPASAHLVAAASAAAPASEL